MVAKPPRVATSVLSEIDWLAPGASVIVTNPTHYAVALKYDHGRMNAPVVVAKGVDAIALKIREVAGEAGVPIVENRALARGLSNAEIGAECGLTLGTVKETISSIVQALGVGSRVEAAVVADRAGLVPRR